MFMSNMDFKYLSHNCREYYYKTQDKCSDVQVRLMGTSYFSTFILTFILNIRNGSVNVNKRNTVLSELSF